MALGAARTKSVTCDEQAHLLQGYHAWILDDFRVDCENGILPARVAGLPLTWMQVRFPVFYGWTNNNLTEILSAGRISMALLTTLFGLAVFLISKKLWGTAGGFVSLAVFVFDPNMLGHGCLVASDVTVAFFFTLAGWTFWRLLHRVDGKTVLAAGACLGCLALSKMSAGIFGLMAALMIVVRVAGSEPLEIAGRDPVTGWRRQAPVLAAAVAGSVFVAWTIVWAAYSWRYDMGCASEPLDTQERWHRVLEGTGFYGSIVSALRHWRLLPEAYLYGISFLMRHTNDRTAFLLGHLSTDGFWAFYPLAFLWKTPIATLGLLVAATVSVCRTERKPAGTIQSDLYRVTPLLVVAGVYAAFTIVSRFDIGLRIFFPVYPPLFILAGAAGRMAQERRRLQCIAVVALLVCLVAESATICPHYIAYFNGLAGGPRHAYRLLVDSSLDWGQDLIGLRRWLDEHHVNRPESAFVGYFGSVAPRQYGIQATDLNPRSHAPLGRLTGGVYCVSASRLQGLFSRFPGDWTPALEANYRQLLESSRVDRLLPDDLRQLRLTSIKELELARLWAFLRTREPDAEIGYAILIFNLTDEEVAQAIVPPGLDPATTKRAAP